MSASLGFGVVLQQRVRRSAACRACSSRTAGRADPRSACCSGCSVPPCASPSTVRISWPSACTANIVQDFTARVAVHDDDAAAAARRVAADVRAGQPAVFAQEVREQRPRLDVASRSATPLTVTLTFMPAPPDARTPGAGRAPTSTPARCFLYSTLPRRSACGALRCARGVGGGANHTRRWASAREQRPRPRPRARRTARPPTAPRRPAESCRRRSSDTCTAAAAVAKSPTLRSTF